MTPYHSVAGASRLLPMMAEAIGTPIGLEEGREEAEKKGFLKSTRAHFVKSLKMSYIAGMAALPKPECPLESQLPSRKAVQNRRSSGENTHRRRAQKCTETNPNEAIVIKPSIMMKMCQKFMKRSHRFYRFYFQLVGSILGPFFGKRECVPSMNWFTDGPTVAKTYTTKAVISFRISCKRAVSLPIPINELECAADSEAGRLLDGVKLTPLPLGHHRGSQEHSSGTEVALV